MSGNGFSDGGADGSADASALFSNPLRMSAGADGDGETTTGLPLIELPSDDRTGGDFAAELGKLLGGAEVFRRGGTLMVLNDRRDKLEPVSSQGFRTLVERYVTPFEARVPKRASEQVLRIRRTVSNDLALLTTSSVQFLECIRAVEHLHDVPLPAWRADGSIGVLPAGYDAASRTLTLRECDYVSKPCADGAAFLRELLGEFEFTEPRRSLAVAVSAMLTLFARRILPPLAIRPAFIYTSNAPGGGKTLLADAAIAPVFGRSPRAAFPKREEELEKLLVAEVLAGSECLLFDNVRGKLESSALENLLTSHVFKGRILNLSKTIEEENHLTLFITGNGMRNSEDMQRRALYCELFQPMARAQDRKFSKPLSVAILVERRAEILAALWQIVQSWDSAGRPAGTQSHASFPEWARVIGGMVEHAGFGSPVLAPVLRDGGNRDGEDMADLVSVMRQAWGCQPITFDQVTDLMAERGLFDGITDGCSAQSMDRVQKSRLGRLLVGYDRRSFDVDRKTFRVLGRGHGRRFRVLLPVEAASIENERGPGNEGKTPF